MAQPGLATIPWHAFHLSPLGLLSIGSLGRTQNQEKGQDH